jgi:methyl-accepting chemotaxis protein
MFKNCKIGIRQKLFLLYFLMLTIIMIVVGSFSLNYATNFMKRDAEEKLHLISAEYTARFNSQLKNSITVIRSLESIVLATFDTKAVFSEPNYLKNYKNYLTPIVYEFALNFEDVYIYFNPDLINEAHDIWFIDADGDGMLDRIPEATMDYYDNDYEKKAWFYQPILQGKAIWTDPYPSTFDIPFIFISHTKPLYKDGHLLAVIGTDFIFDDIKNDLENLKVFDSGYAILINDRGNFIIHPDFSIDNHISEVNNGDFKSFYEEMKNENSGLIEYTWYDNQEKVLAFQKLDNDWILAMSVAKDDVYGHLNSFLSKLAYILVICMLVSMIIVLFLSNQIATPIETLSSKIHKIGSGNYDEKLPESYLLKSDELGILARSIDSMKRNLQSSFKTIQMHNIELDMKIAERTQDLLAMNEELQATLEDLQNTQDRLLEARKLEGLGLMLGGISHKLGSPVGNAITSVSNFETKLNTLNAKLVEGNLSKKFLEKQLDELIDLSQFATISLLSANKILSSLKEINTNPKHGIFKTFKLEEVFENTSLRINDLSGNQKIDFYLDCKKSIEIKFYPMLFHDILLNLIKFSVYYNLQNTLHGQIFLSLSESQGHIKLSYKDSGPAITTDQRDLLFDPFTLSRFTRHASGIELYSVYHLVTNTLSGRIHYMSSEDMIVIEFDKKDLIP